MHSGYQRRTRDIADWARNKRRRYIRRDDLLAYLAGKSPPPSTMIHVTKLPHNLYSTTTPTTQTANTRYHQNQQIQQAQQQSEHHHGTTFVSSIDSDLHTFKEALARRPR